MKKSNRWLSLFVALLLLITPLHAFAAEEGQDTFSSVDYSAEDPAEDALSPEEAFPAEEEAFLTEEELLTEDEKLANDPAAPANSPADPVYVFIGDSYLAGTGASDNIAYGKRFKSLLNLSDAQYYENAVVGSGFLVNRTFITQMNDMASGMSDGQKAAVTDLYVLGGWNDRNYSKDRIRAAAKTFLTRAKELFPNATIHVGMISYHLDPEKRKLLDDVKEAYYGAAQDSAAEDLANGGGTQGASGDPSGGNPAPAPRVVIVEGIEYILALHADVSMTGDGLHPANAGHIPLAEALVSYAKGNGTGGKPPVYMQKATISKTAVTLKEGEETTLAAAGEPADTPIRGFRWSSSNPGVAGVSDNGVVSARATGTAVITATAADGSGVSASCTVTVTTALWKGPEGWGFYRNGKIDTSVTGVFKNEHGWWYVEKGRISFQYNGVGRNYNGLWFIRDSKVDFGVNGVVKAGGTWYYFQGGKVQENYNGLQKNEHGWWRIENGIVTFRYNGLTRNQYGLWFIRDSKVDFDVNGVVKAAGVWYYFRGGKVIEDYTGLAKNENGWWYLENGIVDFTHYGLVKNEYGWWYAEKGNITFRYNGVQRNQYGLWCIKNSKVDFDANGLVKVNNGEWYLFNGGKVDEGFNGWKSNEYGTWYVRNGKVDFSVPKK